ncbi:MAG: hypothetical protein JWN69_986 [Alphaproteobacteria bacterium]|nr:hypothetical protein [Alphaproteobacteria bacterium]
MTVHESKPRAARLWASSTIPSSLLAVMMLAACGSSGSEPAPEGQASNGLTVELPAAEPYQTVTRPEAAAPATAMAAATDKASVEAIPEAAPADEEAPEKKPPEKTGETKAAEKDRKATPAPTAPTAPAEEKQKAAPAKAADRGKSDASDEVRLRPTRPPLGDAEIARTIDRIGFACGKVVSSAAVEGGPKGTYKINCSSGEAYQGTTKGGHLFFRPWTG